MMATFCAPMHAMCGCLHALYGHSAHCLETSGWHMGVDPFYTGACTASTWLIKVEPYQLKSL